MICRTRRARWIGLAAVMLLGSAAGCDRKASEIKSQLRGQELALFEQGQRLSTECWACHDFYEPINGIGPYLVGVFGRKAGYAGSFPYSPALSKSGVIWDEVALRRYLSSPNEFIPGTTMVYRGMSDRGNLEALLFYMRRVTVPESN